MCVVTRLSPEGIERDVNVLDPPLFGGRTFKFVSYAGLLAFQCR
jgi:hypothetical protein